MNRKRNYISEILDIRSRSLKRTDHWNHFTKRMDHIVGAIAFLQKSKGNQSERLELLKYISIGAVACLEGYLRSVFRDLVEHGSPFAQNVRKFQDVKLDLGTVFDLRKEKISYGEFVAHLLPFNNLEDINKNLSILMGSDFLDDIKNLESELFNGNVLDFMPDIFERLKRLYSQRHIFCHEIAVKEKPRYKTEDRNLTAAIVFVFATDELVERLLAGKPNR